MPLLIIMLQLLLLPLLMLCALVQLLLRETRHMHATRGFYEQLAAMQQHNDEQL